VNCIRSYDVKFDKTEQLSLSAWANVQVGSNANPSSAPATAPSEVPEKRPASDTASRLNELQRLLDQKLITPEEFVVKRSAILNSL
jgi:hypothetical protein